MSYAEVTCAYCKNKFQKSINKIKATERAKKRHTCTRQCAAKLSNMLRHSAPISKNAEHTRRDMERYPDKSRARKLVHKALRNGQITPPELCESCCQCLSLEAHHEDHSRPYYLVWLCKDCHAFHDKHKLMGYGTDYADQIGVSR